MYPQIKRLLDILMAVLGIGILSPFLLPVVCLLRLTAEGEVFYRQERIGLNCKPFLIWKFATMLKNSPEMGSGTITLRNDARVTSIGRFLRRWKINELPQLLNVLMGDMSFVGPRPLDAKAFGAYPEILRERIYSVKPGITGVGSIVFRDEEKLISASGMAPREFYQQHIAPYKGALEIWYQKHQGFFTDFMLICLTFWAILSPKNNLIFRIFPTLPENHR